MRLVLDTNVVVSALLWGGNPERLITAAGESTVELFTSASLLAELAGLLGRAKLAAQLERKGLRAEEVLARYLELAQLIDAPPIEEPRLRDPDDAAVLACAAAARRCHRLGGCRPADARPLSRNRYPLARPGDRTHQHVASERKEER